jgi:hypothetical protein
MRSVREELTDKQMQEMSDYERSTTGILSGMAANSTNNIAYTPMDTLKVTGEWNRKTAEDYVEMCKSRILENKNLQSDLLRMAEEWRTAVVKEIGRDRYDELSREMQCDLSIAYIDYRVDQMMVDYMVSQEMPKSSVEYILRKGAEGSLLGLTTTLTKSPLQEEIDRRGEAAYHPSAAERGAGRVVSFGTDLATTGGLSSWAAIAKLAGVEVAFAGAEYLLDKKVAAQKPMTVEQCISQGVFDSYANVFDDFRRQGKNIISYENEYVLSLNEGLKNKMAIQTSKPLFNLLTDTGSNPLQMDRFTSPFLQTSSGDGHAEDREQRYPNVPLVVQPGHEEEYLAMQQEEKDKKQAATYAVASVAEDREAEEPQETEQQQAPETEAQQTNDNAWAGLLQSVGLDGISDIGRNLPYVIATLPDMLLGLFTGHTQSVGLRNGMIPFSSILMGLYVKNPLLKMLLIGMGGANLVNKVGHESIEHQQPQYKYYADEALNPRIAGPVVQGNTLIASIDNVPCSVTLTEHAARAYAAGVLPLNTLANAVLTKYDESSGTSVTQNIDMQTTVDRDRGLTLKV